MRTVLRCFAMLFVSISWTWGASQLLSLASLWLWPFASELTQFTLPMCSVLRTDLEAREAAKVGIGNAQGVVCSRDLNEAFSQLAFLVVLVLHYSFGVRTLSNIC